VIDNDAGKSTVLPSIYGWWQDFWHRFFTKIHPGT